MRNLYWIVFILLLTAAPLFAQQYPPNYRDIPCPDTGQTLYQTSPDFFNMPYFQKLGPKHYAARCHYETGSMTGVWSDDFTSKNNICNWPRWKGRMLGDHYNLVETPVGEEPSFGFSYKIEPDRKTISIVDVFKGSTSSEAGLKPGNEIIEINGLNVAKLSADDLIKFLQSGDEMTFKVHDLQQMIYKNLKIKKGLVPAVEKRFDLYSPIHFAEVAYTYKVREGHEKEDGGFWYAKALEFLKKFEDQGVICVDLDLSDQGPLAE